MNSPVDKVDTGVLQGQVRNTETFFDLRFLVDFLGQTCQRFPCNQVHAMLDLKAKTGECTEHYGTAQI